MAARKHGRIYFANTKKILEDFGNASEMCKAKGIKQSNWFSWLAKNKPIKHFKLKSTHEAFKSLVSEGYLREVTIDEVSNV